jgi:voltage-gated potassium channel
MTLKKRIETVFEDPHNPYFSITNDVFAVATIISVLVIVFETVPSLAHYHNAFLTIEWVTVVLFTLEYCARLWIAKPKRAYYLSFFGIIDLVAILPSFIGIGNFTFLKSARVVRIIRFLRVVRLAKLSRIRVKDAEETFGILGFNIAIYGFALMFIMLLIGVLLHVFVNGDGHYWSIPSGMYWAFSVFLGGLPAPIPPGTAGTTIFIIAKFCGMALFGLLVGIVGKMFNDWLLGKK